MGYANQFRRELETGVFDRPLRRLHLARLIAVAGLFGLAPLVALAADASATSPSSACSTTDSGRVHPNPLLQQAYAFTRAWKLLHSLR